MSLVAAFAPSKPAPALAVIVDPLIGVVAGGGVASAILRAIVGLIKNKMALRAIKRNITLIGTKRRSNMCHLQGRKR